MRHEAGIGLGRLCGLFGYSRQAYYAYLWRGDRQATSDAVVLSLVVEKRREMPRLGTRKLFHLIKGDLEQMGIKMGRDALFDLLGQNGLLIRRKRSAERTTYSRHWYRCYENLIQGRTLTGPGQVWASDITYIRLKHGFAYLSLTTDAYSRKIVGYKLTKTLEAHGPLEAIQNALKREQHEGLIHHSDRGIQYCSNQYTRCLSKAGIRISMGEIGNAYENAIAERVNGTLKHELGLEATFSDFAQAKRAVDQAIHIYNAHRPHLAIEMLTPDAAHNGGLKISQTLWKPSIQQAA